MDIIAGELVVEDGADITVSSPSGIAGDLTITTHSSTPLGFQISNSRIRAVTGSGDDGNDITLNVASPLMLLSNGSEISTRGLGSASGGDVVINAENSFIVANSRLGNNDILADASEFGSGGTVTIRALELFNFQTRSRGELEGIGEFDVRNLPTNDISAVSQGDPAVESQGTTTIETLGLDPNRGVIELPSDFTNPQINQSCTTTGSEGTSEFTYVGQGGLPSRPTDVLNRQRTLADLGSETLDTEAENADIFPDDFLSSEAAIVEAQGWAIGDNGEIALIAQASNTASHEDWQSLITCPIVEMPINQH